MQGSVRYGQLMPDRSVEVHPGVSMLCLASVNLARRCGQHDAERSQPLTL
jgi:hypothetical protein